MAKQTIGIGSVADDGNGDTLRVAFDKCNDNFDELYVEPYYIQIALTPNGTAGSSGNGKGFARVPKAGNITGVVLDCDPNNEPSSIQIQADLNKVDRSTGTATSVLSAVAAISVSANTGSGTVNGTQSVSAGDMLRVDLDQYSDGNDVIMTVEITPT